jgi:hypothetical protein
MEALLDSLVGEGPALGMDIPKGDGLLKADTVVVGVGWSSM